MNDLGFELRVVYRPASRREIVERSGVAEERYENAFDSVLCRKHQTSFFTRLDRSTSSRSFATYRLPCGTGFSKGQRTLEEGTTSFTTRFIACHLGCFEDSYEEETVIVGRQHARMPQVRVIYGYYVPFLELHQFQ